MARAPRQASRRDGNELEIGDGIRRIHERPLFRHDRFTGEELLMHAIPRVYSDDEPLDRLPRPVVDTDITVLMEYLQATRAYKKVPRTAVEASVALIGVDSAFSSVVAFLDALPEWDQVQRLDNFFRDYCGTDASYGSESEAETMNRNRYITNVAQVMFAGILSRAYQPGCKYDTVVVLEGLQGIGKSTLLRIMALREDWFSDSMPGDLKHKDAKSHLVGKLIVEMAETQQMRRTGYDAVKAFITVQIDKFRPSYGHRDRAYPRTCVFIATTNDAQYLSDPTGNRRFLPIRTTQIDLEAARRDIFQLYAEARHRLRLPDDDDDRIRPWIENDIVIAQAMQEQVVRETEHPWLQGLWLKVENEFKAYSTEEIVEVPEQVLRDAVPVSAERFTHSDAIQLGVLITQKLHGFRVRKRRMYRFRRKMFPKSV